MKAKGRVPETVTQVSTLPDQLGRREETSHGVAIESVRDAHEAQWREGPQILTSKPNCWVFLGLVSI